MNDIYELVSNAKSTVWLNPGTYIIDKPLTPNPNIQTFIMYAIGATLIVKSDYMFNYNGWRLGIVGGIIKPLSSSQLVNGQSTIAYFDKTQIGNVGTFLANVEDITNFPRIIPIEM